MADFQAQNRKKKMNPPWDGLQTWMVDKESMGIHVVYVSWTVLTIGENYRGNKKNLEFFMATKIFQKRLFFFQKKIYNGVFRDWDLKWGFVEIRGPGD